MELHAKKLESHEIAGIAADPFARSAPLSIIRLLCHVEWMNDELERVSEERDSLRDAQDSSAMPYRLKRSEALLHEIRSVLGIPSTDNPVPVVKSLKESLQGRASGGSSSLRE